MNRLLLLTLLGLAGILIPAHSQVSKTVHLSSAGTLREILTEEEKESITALTITGKIDYRDFVVLNEEMPALDYLDLRESDVARYRDGNNVVYPANEIPTEAFAGNRSIHMLLLPESLEFIGYNSFLSTDLTEIVLYENLQVIDDYAFEGSMRLEKINFPSQLEYIGESAFFRNASLISIDLSACINLKTLEKSSFYSTQQLTGLILPPNIEVIKEECFEFAFVNSLILPATLKYIDGYSLAFPDYYDNGLKTLICLSPTPPEVTGEEFPVDPTRCDLYVPVNSVELYRNAYGWRKFFLSGTPDNLIFSSNVENGLVKVNGNSVQKAEVKMKVTNSTNEIIIEDVPAGEMIKIYDIKGHEVYQGIANEYLMSVPVKNGETYIVVSGNGSEKVLIK